jgi:ketosteroid isomerase-like protein
VKSDAFRAAVEASDLDAFIETLSPSVVLRGPVRSQPIEGRDALRDLFAILFRAFEDLRFVAAYSSADGDVLHFLWRLDGEEVEGVDMLHFDSDGLVDDYRVLIRPLAAVIALRDAVWSQLDA